MGNTAGYWTFIETYHPNYYSDDRVLQCDILLRYLNREEVSDEDLEWIKESFKSNKEILGEMVRLETDLFREALEAYYKGTLK